MLWKNKRRPRRLLSLRASRTGRLAARFALLHEAGLGGTRKLLAVGADSLGFAGIVVALLHERGLRRAGQRLAVLADRLGVAGCVLREGRTGSEGGDDSSQDNALHGCLPKRKVVGLELGIRARSSSWPANFAE